MQYTKKNTHPHLYTRSLFILFRKLSTGDRKKYLAMLIDIIT